MNPAQDNSVTSPVPSVVPQQPVTASVVPPQPTQPHPTMVGTAPTVAVTGKRSMGQKLLFIIPVLILLGTMAVVAALIPSLRKPSTPAVVETPLPSLEPASPIPTIKPNPTQGWKEYSSRESQISFRYPPTLSLKELKSASTYTITLTDEASGSATVLKVVTAKNTTGADLLTSQREVDLSIKTTEKDVSVSGVATKTIQSTLISNPDQPVLYTAVDGENVGYNVLWYTPSMNPDWYTQILATVKFVSPGITADWQTYTNTRGGYSLRYPPSWSLNTSGGDLKNATASAQTVSIRKNPAEAQFQNLVIQTTVADAKTKIELSASEIVSSIQNLSGWKDTPTLDFRTIGGAQAEILSGEKDGAWYVYSVMWYRNILIEMTWRDTLLRVEQENFNDILGSFQLR